MRQEADAERLGPYNTGDDEDLFYLQNEAAIRVDLHMQVLPRPAMIPLPCSLCTCRANPPLPCYPTTASWPSPAPVPQRVVLAQARMARDMAWGAPGQHGTAN